MNVPSYRSEILRSSQGLDLSFFNGKSLLLTGGTGLMGSYLIDLLLSSDVAMRIFAPVRDASSAAKRFERWANDPRITIFEHDLLAPFEGFDHLDFLLHLASPTHPLAYATHPISALDANYLGTRNLLFLAERTGAKFLLASSCEVYGDATGLLDESSHGHIDLSSPRSAYNEGKRAAESLISAFGEEKGVKGYSIRFGRCYGPTMKLEDTKALSQFLLRAARKESVVLKSEGRQLFDYTYVADAVRALIELLRKDDPAHRTYNFSSGEAHPLREIAERLASMAHVQVVFDIPPETERKGYSKAFESRLDSSLFRKEIADWDKTSLNDGLERTLNILKERLQTRPAKRI